MSDQLYPEDLLRGVQKIKALLFDIDGVMTDGSIVFDAHGDEIKHFNVQDGLGFYFAKKSGLLTGIITGREAPVNKIRAEELNVDFLSQGHKNKVKPYDEFKQKFGLTDEEVAFVGDDLLDLPVMLRCGFSASVANGRDEVKKRAHYITQTPGGKGAVREVIEFVLKQQGKWQSIVDNYYGNDSNK